MIKLKTGGKINPPMQITYKRALRLGFMCLQDFCDRYVCTITILILPLGRGNYLRWDIYTHYVDHYINGKLTKEGITSAEFKELTRKNKGT